jgi:hypothetical protein
MVPTITSRQDLGSFQQLESRAEMSRDTTTGSNFEDIVKLCIERSCKKNRLEAHRQKFVGMKPGGGRHRVDYELISLENENVRGLVSCKTQNHSGSADEKVAYEVIKLLYLMQQDQRYKHAWIVLGGIGWKQEVRNFLSDEIHHWIPELQKGRLTFVLSTDELMATDLCL